MEQVFWVELARAPDVSSEIETPSGVTLLDRTKPGKGRAPTRLYFRSDRGIENGAIALKSPGQPPVTLSLRVRTYRQDIEDKACAIPGLDPAVRKRGRSYYTDDRIALAGENPRKTAGQPSSENPFNRPTPYDRLTDEQLFQSLPSWNVPRACYSNWPCPNCGEAIFQTSGYYPWKPGPEYPYKARCPLCERLFPTNDFAADDFTGGPYPDDGWGNPDIFEPDIWPQVEAHGKKPAPSRPSKAA